MSLHSAGSTRQDQAGSPDFSADPQITPGIRRSHYMPGRDDPRVRPFVEGMGETGYHIMISNFATIRYGHAARCVRLSGLQSAIFEDVFEHCAGLPRYHGRRKQEPFRPDSQYIHDISKYYDFNVANVRRALDALADRRILVQVGDAYTVNLDYALWKRPDGSRLPAECVQWLDGPEGVQRRPHGCESDPGPEPEDTGPDPEPDAPAQSAGAPAQFSGCAGAPAQGSLLDARAPASDSGSLDSASPTFPASSNAQGEYIYIPQRIDAGARADAPGRDAHAHAREAIRPCCPPPAPADSADGEAPAVAPGVDYDPAIISAFRAFLEMKMTLRYVAYNCFYMETSYHSWWLMKAAKRAWLRKKYSAAYIQTILANWAKAGEPDPGPEDDFDDAGKPIPPGSRVAAPQPGGPAALDRESIVAASDARQAKIEEWSRMMGEEYERRYGARTERMQKQGLIS